MKTERGVETRYPPFTVTPTAIQKIEDVGGSVRIDLVDGGCCGTAYDFRAHRVIRSSAARARGWSMQLLVSHAAMEILPGTKLDYSDRVRPPRFRVINNPNTPLRAPLRCPCNRSFGSTWPGRCQPNCRAKTPMPWDS